MRHTAKAKKILSTGFRLIVGLVLLFLGALPPAGAATYLGKAEYLHHGGESDRVIDVVYVPLGYTDNYLYPAFTGVTVPYTSQFLTRFAPFTSYPSFFNIHRLDAYSTVSEESALRQMAVDNLPDVDLIIFVHRDNNIREYAIFGGDVHINGGSHDTTLAHELGHAIGYLDDEYVEAAKCPSGVYGLGEPTHINATINTNRASLKWREWLGIGGVDLYQGALYCLAGVYRPSATCRMRDSTQPFDPVCREGLIRQINARVNPTISQTPGIVGLNGVAPQVVTLSIEPDLNIKPQGMNFNYKWVLSNSGSGESRVLSNDPATSLTLDLGTLIPNVTHLLQVYHVDPDVNNYLRMSALDAVLLPADRGWSVRVNATSIPTITTVNPAAGGRGTYVYLTGNNFCSQQCNTIAPTETTVRINGVAAPIQWITPTYLLFQVPAGATTGPITVTTPGGTATSTGTFTVLPSPTLTSFSPGSGPVGTAMNISGTNLCINQCYTSVTTETQVWLNGVAITPFWVTPNFILFYVPPGATTGKFSVSTPGGTATSAGTFTVTP